MTVTERGFTDSAHQLSGTVLLTNPNTFRALTVSVQDLTDINGLECRIEGAQKVLIPASGTARVPYRCTGAPAAGADAKHLIRVTGTGIDPIDHGTAVKYRTSEVDRKVTVSDDRYRFDPAWRITWSAAGTEHRREYSIPVSTAAGSCQVFSNTASLGSKGPASTASFGICAPRGAGGGAQGFFDRLSTTGAGGWGFMIGTGALLAAVGAFLVLRARRRPRA
ncbi:hypothetical protein AB3K78_14640 [Leucobacter sp. HNU]|uniref:hypothetical protein n=1 Tax=Leucobacter sp. HNU TaxID=3236805 RepID=UPI003A8104D6